MDDFCENDVRCKQIFDIWGAKTQGEPYHICLLAVACLIESRLGEKAFVYGDITRGQCKKAVELANQYLDKPISVPDRCDLKRFQIRISKLEMSEKEQFEIFQRLYLGTKDAEYGKYLREVYSESIYDEYWRIRFENNFIETRGFSRDITEYLIQGFGIYTLFAQFAFARAENKKVDRYILIDEIKEIFISELGDKCEVSRIMEEYLQKERQEEIINISENIAEEQFNVFCEQDASETFRQIMEMGTKQLVEESEKYDITTHEELIYYEEDNSIEPNLYVALKKSFTFYNSLLEEETYKELMKQSVNERCKWLVEQNRSLLLRDKDWNKIFTDIENNEMAFSRYYPMVRVRINSTDLIDMVKAIVLNDAFFEYCKSM